MSKPTPSSRTKKARSPPASSAPTSTCALARGSVNFQALLSSFCRISRAEHGIGNGRESLRDGHPYVPTRVLLAQLGGDAGGDLAEVDGLATHLGARDP